MQPNVSRCTPQVDQMSKCDAVSQVTPPDEVIEMVQYYIPVDGAFIDQRSTSLEMSE